MKEAVAEQFSPVYDYIIEQESKYRTERVPLASNWTDWNMYEHVDRSFTLKNSRFYQGNQDYKRPFNNIILPIANVNYRSEGFDVKDVQIYVDNKDAYHKSFFARKFHDWWAVENKIDTAIDESVESYFDYGLILVKNVNEARPEVIQLQQIAFCDQKDIMSGPICLKHYLDISELNDYKGKWYDQEVDKAILMSRFEIKSAAAHDKSLSTPGKYVEVYELHGVFPEKWLGPEKLGEDWQDTGKYTRQVHIVTYYTSPTDGSKKGICLFKGKVKDPVFKALKRDPIYGRACGRGGIEELFHAQIWTNFSDLHISQMLEAVSKIVLTTNNSKVKSMNNLANIKHGQILDLGSDGTLNQLNIQAINKGAFDSFTNKWEQIARTIGSASDPQLGLNPTSGTPLGTTEIVTSQGQGIHEYRQGKIAEFWQEIYRDWVIPYFSREINKGYSWMEKISLDELQMVADSISKKEANNVIKKMILSGKDVTQEQVPELQQALKQIVLDGGEDRFMEIIEDEFEKLPLDIEISIKNKQKNIAENVSKLNSLFRILFTPGAIQAIQQSKELSTLLNEILEGSNLSPIKYGIINTQSNPAPIASMSAETAGPEATLTNNIQS